MNIAFFSDTYLPQINGVVTSIEIFRQTLTDKGHNVYIFCPQTEFGQKKADPDYVFRFKSAKLFFQPEYRLSWPYSRALNKFKSLNIDIIHTHTPFTMGMLAVFLAQHYKKPLVHTYHTLFMEYIHYLPIPSDYAKNFVTWASKSFCNQNHLVIVPSRHIKDEITDYNVLSPIEVIPTGINLTDYHKTSTANAKEKYKIDTKKHYYLVTISRIAKEKNISFLLDAFKKLKEKHSNLKLIMIGDGPEREKQEEKAKELGIFDDIIMTGYIERSLIFPLLKLSKIFIFASKTETQGLVLLEAMSMKVPCVAIDSMGVSDVMEDNQGGFLSKDDLEEYTTIVSSLITDPKLYEEKCKDAYKRATHLSANKMTKKLIETYEKLLANK
ncbi:MAG: glycosyltransferase [Candidatus Margulisbacteria bacterium]|nr:glycosyltransferase [Candidatus Margulisiibacteriota bacterium]